jgi:prevent-host-death family protein
MAWAVAVAICVMMMAALIPLLRQSTEGHPARPIELAARPASSYMTIVVTQEYRAVREVQLRDAKASFSAVVDQAAKGECTVVTRHGAPVAVVLGYDEWQRLICARPSLADLLLAFPEGGDVHRDRTPARDPGL